MIWIHRIANQSAERTFAVPLNGALTSRPNYVEDLKPELTVQKLVKEIVVDFLRVKEFSVGKLLQK